MIFITVSGSYLERGFLYYSMLRNFYKAGIGFKGWGFVIFAF